ncbi:hypothetical protein [Streptomyces sp. MB09-02B]|uniref:hypothetical protein n=1 Tax=Streptomyces sp. MB09-02B TaxID=3028667 RepID=UPI0029A3247E|nr:hypothetical protein [Streptomyces sp. MB09-02B]MDX3641877.1 hypothetical protein [Streptomyces sp. MB09-02B]
MRSRVVGVRAADHLDADGNRVGGELRAGGDWSGHTDFGATTGGDLHLDGSPAGRTSPSAIGSVDAPFRNPDGGAARFDVPWGDTTYRYRLPSGAAAIFTTRPA